MKICYDTLENIYLSKEGNLKKGRNLFLEKESCKTCGEPYLTEKGNPSEFCCNSCSRLGKFFSDEHKSNISAVAIATGRSAGKNNYFWKGGVKKLNLPLYDTYAPQLKLIENIRPHFDVDGRKLLEVQCSKCNEWYVPKQTAVRERLKALNEFIGRENRLYCSNKCKTNCSVFRKQAKNYLVIDDINDTNKSYTIPELKSWANEVLARANHTCEYCGGLATTGHHIKPKKLEPGLALDPDNGLAVCQECHHKYCHRNECSTYSLGKIIC